MTFISGMLHRLPSLTWLLELNNNKTRMCDEFIHKVTNSLYLKITPRGFCEVIFGSVVKIKSFKANATLL